METIVGFVAGYLAGCKDGPDGASKLRSSVEAIVKSDEFKRITGEAMSLAEMMVRRAGTGRNLTGLSGAVGTVTDVLVHRASALGKGSRAA